MAIVRPEGLYQWKILETKSGIEPAPCRIGAYCQSCHSKEQHFTAHNLIYLYYIHSSQVQYSSFCSKLAWYWCPQSRGPYNGSYNENCPVSTVCKSNSPCIAQRCQFTRTMQWFLTLLDSWIGTVVG